MSTPATNHIRSDEATQMATELVETLLNEATSTHLVTCLLDVTLSMRSGKSWQPKVPGTIPPTGQWAQGLTSTGTVTWAQVDGTNAFLQKQFESNTGQVRADLYAFGGADEFENLQEPTHFQPVTADDLMPRFRSTALYDNVAKVMGMVSKKVEAAKEAGTPYASVTVLILTDGEDNASRRHTMWSNKTLVSMATAQGWNVVYLGGGGQNASQVGKECLGLSHGQCLT